MDPNFDPVLEERRRRAAQRGAAEEALALEDYNAGKSIVPPGMFKFLMGGKQQPAVADEPIGDYARRQGMIEESPEENRSVEQGAHQALADKLASPLKEPATSPAQEPSPSASPAEFPRSWTHPFERQVSPAETGPVRIPGSPGYGEAAAAPKREPLSVRYKDKQGNWKTHTLGEAPPTDIARSNTAFDPSESGGGRVETIGPRRTRGESGFGMTPGGPGWNAIEGGPSEAPGVSTADMDSLPMGQRPASYFEDKALERGVAENDAARRLAEILSGNPFAREDAEAGRDVAKTGAIEGVKSQIRQAEERRRQEGYQREAGTLAQQRDEKLAKWAAVPVDDPKRRSAEQEIQDMYEREIQTLREAYGLGARIGQAFAR